VLDPEDGSTIQACESHPLGGSPRSKKWTAEWRRELERLKQINAAPVIPTPTAKDIDNP
jgi:hypothetical protein